MGKVSPLLYIGAVLIIGVSIEVVEGQDRRAAWILVGVLLLGAITFNVQTFDQQLKLIMGILAQPSVKHVGTKPDPGPGTATPISRIRR